MADTNHATFAARLRDINERHRRLASGYVRLEERDGLLVPVASRRMRVRSGLPVHGIATTLGGFLVFKGFLLAYLGPATYSQRVGDLASGSLPEQIGGWLMSADRVTLWIATQLNILF